MTESARRACDEVFHRNDLLHAFCFPLVRDGILAATSHRGTPPGSAPSVLSFFLCYNSAPLQKQDIASTEQKCSTHVSADNESTSHDSRWLIDPEFCEPRGTLSFCSVCHVWKANDRQFHDSTFCKTVGRTSVSWRGTMWTTTGVLIKTDLRQLRKPMYHTIGRSRTAGAFESVSQVISPLMFV